MFTQVGLALRVGAGLFTLLRPIVLLRNRLLRNRMLETESGKNSQSLKTSNDTSNCISSHLTNPMEHDTFEDWWKEIEDYAEKAGVSTSYIEEEFLLDGDLIKVNINYKKQSK